MPSEFTSDRGMFHNTHLRGAVIARDAYLGLIGASMIYHVKPQTPLVNNAIEDTSNQFMTTHVDGNLIYTSEIRCPLLQEER